MGRKTYEVLTAQGGHGAMPGLDVVVFSRTLPAATHRGVRIYNEEPRDIVSALTKGDRMRRIAPRRNESPPAGLKKRTLCYTLGMPRDEVQALG